MLTLVQFPWSPFCLVQRRIMEFAGVRFRTVNIPNGDRTLVWKWTKGNSYEVPILKDGRKVIYETSAVSQEVSRHLDSKFDLDLFPAALAGLQDILWRHIEDAVEGPAFKLTDIHAAEFVAKSDWMRFLRHKERKFGRGCLEAWRRDQAQLQADLFSALAPYEAMLETREFLLDERPRFVDFDLYGMVSNYLFSGHYALPPGLPRLRTWYRTMRTVTR